MYNFRKTWFLSRPLSDFVELHLLISHAPKYSNSFRNIFLKFLPGLFFNSHNSDTVLSTASSLGSFDFLEKCLTFSGFFIFFAKIFNLSFVFLRQKNGARLKMRLDVSGNVSCNQMDFFRNAKARTYELRKTWAIIYFNGDFTWSPNRSGKP